MLSTVMEISADSGRRMGDRLRSTGKHEGGSAWLWPAMCAAAWLLRYLSLYRLPWRSPPFWGGWFDQSHYLASTRAFAHGDLSASAHWYPLGYSLLATPFAWLTPSDPFFLPDLLLFVATAMAFQRAMRIFAIGTAGAALIFLAACLVQTPVAKVWLQPWNTNLSAALLWWLIAGAIASFAPARRTAPAASGKSLLGLGCLAGALPLVRPIDASLSLICLGFVFYGLRRRRQPLGRALGLVVAGILIPVVPYVLLHLAIYGPHATPYMADAARNGFVLSDIGWKSYVLLVAPRPWFPATRSILETVPWLVLGAAGIVALLATAFRERRISAAFLTILLFASAVPFIAYADLQPPGLWKFKNFHYFKWMIPFFGAGLFMWLRLLGRAGKPLAAIAALIAVALPLCIRILPVPVADGTPARMLLFHADASRDWAAAYFADATLTDSAGAQHNVQGFHLMPDAANVRAIAVKRFFAANPVLDDPGDPVVQANRGRPYARYGERISFGWPLLFADAADPIVSSGPNAN